MNELLVEELFRDAVRSVDTLPPPLEAFRRRAAGELRRRRRRSVLGTTAAVGVLVLAVAGWLGTRPGEDATVATPPVVTMVENPANVAWWAEGQLHLANVAVAVPQAHHVVTDLVEINGGAVYGDDTGAVAFVGDDGEVTRIGTKAPGAPLVASDETGWVAWVDPRGRSPELVVYDLTAREVLARRAVSDPDPDGGGAGVGSRPIALDGDQVFYATPDGDRAWTVPDGGTEPVEPAGLLAVASATRVWQLDPATIRIVQPFFSISFDRIGTGATISPDGNRVLTHTFGVREGGSFGTVHLYDARSGESLWTGLARRDVPIAATLGPENEVSYLVEPRAERPHHDDFVRQSSSSPYELRSCDQESRQCRSVTQLPRVETLPVLAR